MQTNAAGVKRNYTEKDLIQLIKNLENKIENLTNAVRQLSDRLDEKKPSERKYVYGIKGLASLFGCSVATAQRIKSSGIIDGAIIQRNRRILVDAEKALQLYDDPYGRWGIKEKTRLK